MLVPTESIIVIKVQRSPEGIKKRGLSMFSSELVLAIECVIALAFNLNKVLQSTGGVSRFDFAI